MNCAGFLEFRDKLLSVAEDSHMHLLDRIDAYLELAILFQNDGRMCITYVRFAHELIRMEQQT